MSSAPICTPGPARLESTAKVPVVPVGDAEIIRAAGSMRLAGGGSAHLLTVLMDPGIDFGELAYRIGADAGLVARVLRVANSAYYGQSGKVGTMSHAIGLLGMTALRGVAAAACFDRLSLPQAAGLDARAFRYHSLATACAAERLARLLHPALAEQAFVAGLLHDIGLLVQHRLRPQAVAAFNADGATLVADPLTGARRSRMEAHSIGVTHAYCGQLVLHTWRLPPALVQAVAVHDIDLPAGDAPPAAETAALGGLLAMADCLADEAGFGIDADGWALRADCRPVDASAAAEPWAAVAAALPDAVQRLAAVFGD